MNRLSIIPRYTQYMSLVFCPSLFDCVSSSMLLLSVASAPVKPRFASGSRIPRHHTSPISLRSLSGWWCRWYNGSADLQTWHQGFFLSSRAVKRLGPTGSAPLRKTFELGANWVQVTYSASIRIRPMNPIFKLWKTWP